MTGGIIIAGVVTATTGATPLVLAAIGETVAERAGVLNLGVEGMMLAGAVCAFIVTTLTGSDLAGIFAALAAGAALASLFGLLTLTLAANQVATGLALTIFGSGLSALLGAHFVGRSVAPLPKLDLPLLSGLPVLGPLLHQDVMVYASVAVTAATAWTLTHTRMGLILRAVGESDSAAHALGHHVIRTRYAAVLFGGAMAGAAGAYLSLAATPMWIEGLSAGRGWIALALVVFGSWRPWRVLLGAYLFGGINALQLFLQGAGLVAVPTQVLAMIPYLATIVVLTIMSSGRARRLGAPACLGKAFRAVS
jgi:simple sugar transport system permease protein